MSDSDCSTVINESPVDVEKVTIWYRCKICSCYLFSIPALKRHSRAVHNVHTVELPRDPPPGALQGKIYYTYDTIYNQIPKPYLFKQLNGWTHDELIEKLEKKASSVRNLFQTFPDASPPERDFPIRVKKLKDLLESSAEENENEPPHQEKNSSNPSPLDSPPDSGIHGSECHDDERQQPVVPAAIANQVNETSQNGLDGDDTQTPSTSSGANEVTNVENPPKRKLPCTLCHKKFNNVSSLNFHTKKFHPGCDPEKPTSHDKVILTIQRDDTGNFSSKSGSKTKPPETNTEEDKNDNSKRQQIRTRKRTISSNNNDVTSTSQTKQPEGVQTRLRHSRENSQSGHKKQRKSSYYNDSEYQPGPVSQKWQKFVVSDREESENESVSDVSESTLPVAKKKTNVGRGRKKTRQTDIPDSPIAKNTRTKSRIISPTRSRSENESSTSELEISDEEKSDSGGESDDTEELTEKSTTSEESLSPPSLTNYGSDDDLFTPVITKRKKQKVPKENQDCDKKRELATKPARKSAPRAPSEVSSIESGPESEISSVNSSPASKVSSKKSKVSSGKKDSAKKQCTLCPMKYKDASSFIQHLYKAHKGTEMFFTCGLCDKRFSTAQDISIFNNHIIEEKKAAKNNQK